MQRVLLEFDARDGEVFEMAEAAARSEAEAERQAIPYLDALAGLGIGLVGAAPVPMLIGPEGGPAPSGLSEFAPSGARPTPVVGRRSMVIPADVPAAAMAGLHAHAGVHVWPDSRLALVEKADCGFEPPVAIRDLQELLGVAEVWDAGARGQGIVVGILDEGVSGEHYPVIGGFVREGSGATPGGASVQSHGSMCAADVLVAAPEAKLYDYPFLGVPRSGGALQMFQAALNQRRIDGTPHLTNNSYGFVGVPDPAENPDHEVHNLNHPLHRKIREVVATGIACFFAAGNCGQDCPSGNCHASGVGPGRSIHGSNSLEEVVTIAAVNAAHVRIGYSSQGPGMFARQKPDLSAYSHFHGNFGPGQPAGGENFDNGTSAATPVAAGVAALLMSAVPGLSPAALKAALIASALPLGNEGWSPGTGHGVVNAAAAYRRLLTA